MFNIIGPHTIAVSVEAETHAPHYRPKHSKRLARMPKCPKSLVFRSVEKVGVETASETEVWAAVVITCLFGCRYEYLFNFDQMFEIHDDIEVLKRMGLAFGLEKGACSRADLTKAMKMVPKALEPYLIGR